MAQPVYNDTLSPFAKQFGKVGEDLGKTIRLITAPLQWLAHQQDRIDKHFNKALKDIPKENLVTPPEQILIPTIEKLKYYNENDEVAKLYQNLLNNAFDKTKLKNVHPAFIDIINQLSIDEVIIIDSFEECKKLDDIKEDEFLGFNFFKFESIRFLASEKSNDTDLEIKDKPLPFSDNDLKEIFTIEKNIETSVYDGTCKIKLFPIDKLNNIDYYEMYIEHLLCLNVIESFEISSSNYYLYHEEDKINLKLYKFRLTEFGKLFYKVCNKK